MFYIHPDECIDCGLCLSICPVDAIVWDAQIAQDAAHFIRINREFFAPEVTDLGSPGGWDRSLSVDIDHPAIAAQHTQKKQDT